MLGERRGAGGGEGLVADDLGEEGLLEGGEADLDGELLEHVQARVGREDLGAAVAVEEHKVGPQAEGAQGRRALHRVQLVVHEDDRVGDRVLVAELRVDERSADWPVKVARLVPADGVVVDVHVPEALHHLELVLFLLGVILDRGHEREDVRHLEHAVGVHPEQLSRRWLRRVARVLHDLEQRLRARQCVCMRATTCRLICTWRTGTAAGSSGDTAFALFTALAALAATAALAIARQ